ncbi:MAG: hypothetical protein HY908_22550 [Myxococcales bacterium]|nr:hypothetical protein [Myxococcales bacterium]
MASSALAGTTSAGTGDATATAPTGADSVDLRAWLVRHGVKSWKGAICMPRGVEVGHFGRKESLPVEGCTCDRTMRLGSRELLVCHSHEGVSLRSALYRVDGNALVPVPPVLRVAGGWMGTTRPGPELDGQPLPDPTYWLTFAVSYRFDIEGDAVVLVPEPSDYYSCERNAQNIRDAWKAPFDPSFARQRRDFIAAVNAAKEACNNRGRYYYREGRLVRDAASAPVPF